MNCAPFDNYTIPFKQLGKRSIFKELPHTPSTQLSPSTKITMNLLSKIFATHDFPSVLDSDNTSIFASEKFTNYCELNLREPS